MNEKKCLPWFRYSNSKAKDNFHLIVRLIERFSFYHIITFEYLRQKEKHLTVEVTQ